MTFVKIANSSKINHLIIQLFQAYTVPEMKMKE